MVEVPPFLVKSYDLLSDETNHAIISWGPQGTSFIVHDVGIVCVVSIADMLCGRDAW